MSKKNTSSKSARQPDVPKTSPAVAQPAMPGTLGWIVLAVILVGTFVTYLPVLDVTKEFTNWDDPAYVTEQPLVRSLDGANIKQMFKTESRVAANYHPLTMLTLAWDYQRGAGSITPFMQTTLTLHLLNTALVFFFVLILFRGNLVVAALSSALFGLHPMHVESVAWVAERKDVLYTALYMISLICYLRHLRSGGSFAMLALAFVSFVASCYAKPMAVTLPVVLVLLDMFEKRSWSVRSALEKIPFFIVSVIFGLLTLKVQSSESGGLVDTTYYTLGERILFAGYGIVQYVIKLFVPTGLSAYYPYPARNGDPESVVYVYAAIAIALIGAVVWGYWKRRSQLSETAFFGMAFFLVTISIVLQFISVGGAVIADRYTYVPYLGFFIILGTLLDRVTRSQKAPYLALSVIAVVSIAFSVLSTARVQTWHDSGALWEDVISQFSSRPINHAYNNRAVYYLDKQDYARAEKDYAYLERIGTDKAYTYKGYGKLLLKSGRVKEAIPRLSKALQFGGPDMQVLRARAYCYSQTGMGDSAIADFTAARALAPNDLDIAISLLQELLHADRFQEALTVGTSMSQMASATAQYHLLMGVINGQLGNHAAARVAFTRALELDPKNEQAARNLEIAKAAGK